MSVASVHELSTETITSPPRGWERRAACAGIASTRVDELFYPAEGTSVPPEVTQLCESCPVRQHCLATALQARYQEGIWGGVNMRLVFGRPARKKRSRSASTS